VISQKREAVEVYLSQMQSDSSCARLTMARKMVDDDFSHCFLGPSEFYRFSWWMPVVKVNQPLCVAHTQIA
jgi:hypothetical protein